MSSSTPPLFGAIDLGTSGVRFLVFDGNGRPLVEAAEEVALETVRPGQATVDPDAAVETVLRVWRQGMGRLHARTPGAHLEGIGLSAALFSVLGVDRAGRPVTPVFTWMDRRAAQEVAAYRDDPAVQRLYWRTGCPMHALHPLAKVRWLRTADPEQFRRAARWISLKEYLLYRLFGEYVVDVSVASSTGYFDIIAHKWHPEALAFAGIRPGQLSTPVDPTYTLRGMQPALAAELGVDPQVPVAVGAGDGMLAHVGSGCVGPALFSSTIGTSGAVRVLHHRPLLDERQRTWCYCLDREWWVAGGAINNGGVVLQWLRGLLRSAASAGNSEEVYHTFDRLAAAVPPGARGLIFIPLLSGERSPGWNDQASGLLAGLRLDHGEADLIRAAMEGVTYRMFQVYRVLADLLGSQGQLRASGGYARSDLWLQIQADVFGRPVTVPEVNQASALGAAAAAMKAVGYLRSWEEAARLVRLGRRYEPSPEAHRIYRRGFELFTALYDRVASLFGELASYG